MIVTDLSSNIKAIESRFCKKHYQELKASGLTDEAIISTGHYSQSKVNESLGIKHTGMVFNYLNPVTGKAYENSKGKPWIRIKPDDWGTAQWDGDDEPPKYLSQKDEGNRPYFSSCISVNEWRKIIKSSRYPLIITEGEKKSDCACSNGHPTIGLAGVYGWVDSCSREGESELEDSRPIPELNIINWKNRTVVLAFDSDVIHKIPVRIALFDLAKWLKEQGAEPYICLIPTELDGSKNGIDDFVVRHGKNAFNLLLKFAFPALVTTGKTASLNLPSDPPLPVKVAMCYSVLKDSWAYRPGMGWYRWNQKYWQSRDNGKGTQFDDDLICFMNEQGWQKQEGKDLNSLVRHLKAKLLIEQWNPQHLIAFTNGTLDTQTGEFSKEHKLSDYLTSQLPYDFDVNAQCPNWVAFLKSALGDQEAVELLQAFIKWILTPKQQDRPAEIEKCLDLIGQPGTGKGTVLDVVQGLVGNDNCASIERGVFEGGAKLASLVDKKVSIDFDASGFIENLGLFAKIVSNEPVQIKRLYNDVYSGRLNTVIVRAYNRFLEVPSGSECLDRRIIAMHFNNVPDSPDPELKGKLRTELPGIFQWAWQLSASECKRRLLWAGSVGNVAEASIKRFEANNPEFTFLSEIYPDGAEGLKLRELYHTYKEWCTDCGLKPTRERKFFETIQLLGAELNGKTMGYKTYTIPSMKDFDVIRHLRLIPKQGDSREKRISLDDSPNPYPESDREIGRNEGVKINIESSEKPVPSPQSPVLHDHPLRKWLVKVPKAKEVNTPDGRKLQIPADYPGTKASQEVKEPLAIRNAIINEVQTREDWDALCAQYDEIRCRWVFYFMIPKATRNQLIPILKGDVKQLTIFDALTPNSEPEKPETPESKEVELTPDDSAAVIDSDKLVWFRSELKPVRNAIATQTIAERKFKVGDRVISPAGTNALVTAYAGYLDWFGKGTFHQYDLLLEDGIESRQPEHNLSLNTQTIAEEKAIAPVEVPQKPVTIFDLPIGTIVRHKESGHCAKIFKKGNGLQVQKLSGGEPFYWDYLKVEPLEEFAKRLKPGMKLKAKKHPYHPFATTSSSKKFGTIETVSLSKLVAIVSTDRHGFIEFNLEAVEVIE